MLSTTLALHATRTNVGTTAIFAQVGTRSILLGESPSIGRKRAMLELFSADPTVGSGRALASTLKRLEREQAALEQADLYRALGELGISVE